MNYRSEEDVEEGRPEGLWLVSLISCTFFSRRANKILQGEQHQPVCSLQWIWLPEKAALAEGELEAA
jgi:hypothetical protein